MLANSTWCTPEHQSWATCSSRVPEGDCVLGTQVPTHARPEVTPLKPKHQTIWNRDPEQRSSEEKLTSDSKRDGGLFTSGLRFLAGRTNWMLTIPHACWLPVTFAAQSELSEGSLSLCY